MLRLNFILDLIFMFVLILGMVIYDNERKENKN